MSLRLRLLSIIGLSLCGLWSIVAVWMFMDARQELRTALDDRLAASARMVAGLMAQMPSSTPSSAEAAPSPLDVIARDGLACEVSLVRGEVMVQTVARTAGSPDLAEAVPGFGFREFGGKRWRTYVLQQGDIRVATADRVDVRARLMRGLAWSAGAPFVAALTGSLLLVWFGIGRGLAPIERVRSALAARRPEDTGVLPRTDTPPELQPLVETIHHLLERVQGAIARERRFTDDAGHELRTPLTAIKTHLQVACLAASRPHQEETVTASLIQADQGVKRLQDTLDQLLLLARLDGLVKSDTILSTNTRSAAKQAQELGEMPHGFAGRVALHAAAEHLTVAISEPLLVVALRNLLDNALRYSPADSQVVLRVDGVDGEYVSFSVCDLGPGLSEEDCAHATRRFWRREAGPQGSGLGLAIVQAIATRHGGDLQLRRLRANCFEAVLRLRRSTANT